MAHLCGVTGPGRPSRTARRRSRPGRAVAPALLVAVALACHDGTGPGAWIPDSPGIHPLPGLSFADTANARLSLAVVVVDSLLRPVPGLALSFQVQPVDHPDYPGMPYYPVLVAPPDSQWFVPSVLDTTDAAGHASVRVALGDLALGGSIVVSAPTASLSTTAPYTIRPGALAGVSVAPRDTAVYAGRQVSLRAHALDRNGNVRGDPVVFAAAPGAVSVGPTTGVVTTAGVGRAAVVARAGTFPDTAWLSVVPQAEVATQFFEAGNGAPRGLYLMQLDGSGRQPLATGLDAYFGEGGIGWSRDGQTLAYARDSSVDVLVPGGQERALATIRSIVLQGARFSRDGQWVYFATGGSENQQRGVYRVRSDGTGLQHLGGFGLGYAPSPSHDGRSVAYMSYSGTCQVSECVRVLDLATNTDRTYGAQDFLAVAYAASWSPVEDLIAYEDAQLQLVLVRSDGLQRRVLAQLDTYVKWIDWSPDGEWLLVAASGVSLFNIGTGVQLPVAQLASYGATAWRP